MVLTTIHHRQSSAWLAAGTTDVAVVWSTEAGYHIDRAAPFEAVAIPAAANRVGSYAVAAVTATTYREQARWFVDHLCGQVGQAVYAAHGFTTGQRKAGE